MTKYLSALVLAILFSLVGCAAIPIQQMSDARQAFLAARQADAEHYAPELFHEAQVLMDDADRFLAERRYGLAGKVAERARTVAIKARRKAVAATVGGVK
ncbi:MAG TPA: DUF4398 domain-containing protein [Gammaproteobacteria bacterium]|nr:DUF4398 domain-containing protein [Gammaproteobacteria bacterium]